MGDKRCTKCGSGGPFVKDARSKDGFGSQCVACKRKSDKEYYQNNKEKRIDRATTWNKENRERRNENNRNNYDPLQESQRKAEDYANRRDEILCNKRTWKRENPEKVRKSNENWRKNNLEKARIKEHNRRVRIADNGGSFTDEEWFALCDSYGNECIFPGCANTDLEMDHIVPVSKGGSNDISNIQPLCMHHNRSKGNRIIDYRRQTSGR